MNPFFIPGSMQECSELLNGIINTKTIHDLRDDEFTSGSQTRSDVSNKQFALLRAYYPPLMKPALFKDYSTNQLKLGRARRQARRLLNASTSYQNMLRVVRDPQRLKNIDDVKEKDSDWPGGFLSFLQQLAHISLTKADKAALESLPSSKPKRKLSSTATQGLSSARSKRRVDAKNYRETLSQEDPVEEERSQEGPSQEMLGEEVPEQTGGDEERDDSQDSEEGSSQPEPILNYRMESDEILYPGCADENVVNTCCINLVKALAQLIESSSSSWTIARLSFTAQFSEGKYTAMTDGALFAKDERITQAIVEVKPHIRSSIHDSVRKQEASEIVGWMMNSTGDGLPDLGGHWALIGQDRHEVYPSFALPNDDYRKYLAGPVNPKENQGFLSIQACGPWVLTKSDSLDQLCEILLAITIKASKAAKTRQQEVDNVIDN